MQDLRFSQLSMAQWVIKFQGMSATILNGQATQ